MYKTTKFNYLCYTCVGLNLKDLDLEENRFKVRRKGGNESIIYYGEEVAAALERYLIQREHEIPCEGSEEALFLSIQKKRMSVRGMENMVTKYTEKLNCLKRITPHKLRSTFGTNLYRETQDIYMVADFLGRIPKASPCIWLPTSMLASICAI